MCEICFTTFRSLLLLLLVSSVKVEISLFYLIKIKSLSAEGSPGMPISHGIVADPYYTIEQVILAAGEQVGHDNFIIPIYQNTTQGLGAE